MRRRCTRRAGRWVRGDHGALGIGWRLGDTAYVLDYDPLNRSGAIPGCWTLWVNGVERDPIDHYLDGAMRYVEGIVS